MNSKNKAEKTTVSNTSIEKTIFVSHSVKDKEIVNAFVDLILHGALSIPINEIFCVSTDGTKIKSGDDWRNSIKESLLSAKINFLIITPNYKESEVCLNEMGAAWVTSSKIIPLIVDPINYSSVGVIQQPKQIEKLLEEDSLDRIKDVVQEELTISNDLIKSERWTVKKKEFLSRVKLHLEINPFNVPMDRVFFNKLQKENSDLNITIESLIKDKGKLESLVKELGNTKDKVEVKKIMKNHNPDSDFDDFKDTSEDIRIMLSRFSTIMRGIIFKDYSGKDIKINWELYRDDIADAIAKDFINEDCESDWETAPEMQNLYKSLNELKEILGRDLNESFYDAFKDEYGAPMKLNNKTFWENVFKIIIHF